MIKTFKTKQPVQVDARTGKSAEVFVEVGEVMFNGLAFYGKVQYFYFENGKRHPIESIVATFTVSEAEQLAAMGPLEGTTFPEQFASLVVRATFYQFENAQYYGLRADGWEIYIAPESEPEIEQVIDEQLEEQP